MPPEQTKKETDTFGDLATQLIEEMAHRIARLERDVNELRRGFWYAMAGALIVGIGFWLF